MIRCDSQWYPILRIVRQTIFNQCMRLPFPFIFYQMRSHDKWLRAYVILSSNEFFHSFNRKNAVLLHQVILKFRYVAVIHPTLEYGELCNGTFATLAFNFAVAEGHIELMIRTNCKSVQSPRSYISAIICGAVGVAIFLVT